VAAHADRRGRVGGATLARRTWARILAPIRACEPAATGQLGAPALGRAGVGAWYGDTGGALARAYGLTDTSDVLATLRRIAGDARYGAPARALARLLVAQGLRVYRYHFTGAGGADASHAPGCAPRGSSPCSRRSPSRATTAS
jgi:hypothetical protein